MSIKIKLILIITGVLVFAGAGMLFFINWQNNKKLTEHAYTHIDATINYTSKLVDFYLSQAENTLSNLAADPLIIEALEQKDPIIMRQVSDKLTAINDSSSDLAVIVLFGVNGSNCIAQTANKEALFAFASGYAETVFCQDIIKTKAPFISPAFIGPVTNKLVIAELLPIKNKKGEMIGFIKGTINLNELRGYLWDLQNKSSAVLLDRNGVPFLSTKEIFLKLDAPLTAVESLIKKNLAANEYNGHFQYNNNLVGYKFNGFLTVIFEESTADSIALVNDINLTIFGIVLIALFFIILALLFFIGQITKRILRLSQVARRLSSGKFDIKIEKQDLKNKDEVGILARSFYQMAADLKQFTLGLESKVNEKTKALSSSLLKITKNNQMLEDTKKAMLNLLEDIEKEKESAHAEKNKAETILYSIGDGVLVIDNNYKILVFNEVAAKLSGFSIKEAVGKRYNQILKFVYEANGDNKERINNEFIKKVLTTGQTSKMANHTVLIAKDGTKIPVSDSAAPLKDKNNKVIGCVVVFHDVTKERQIDQMKTDFVSVASHQLRTPLTGIKWFGELLLKNKLSAKEKQYVEQIHVSNERMIRLVDDLLNVSRIEKGKNFEIIMQQTDLTPIINQVVIDQRHIALNRKIKIEYAKDWPKSILLMADADKIRQVFQNLLDNAAKYSKPNSKIELSCKQTDKDMVFQVKDSGIGIPEKQKSRIFERFFRAENALTQHTDGTGLGLYIVKAIVEGHNGRVWFESKEGQGTTFYVSLPLVKSNQLTKK